MRYVDVARRGDRRDQGAPEIGGLFRRTTHRFPVANGFSPGEAPRFGSRMKIEWAGLLSRKTVGSARRRDVVERNGPGEEDPRKEKDRRA
jgi:hypothetical protein